MEPAFHWVTALHLLTFLQMPHLIAGDLEKNMTPVPNPTDGHSNSFYSISIASLTFVIIIFIIIFFILWYTCRQKKEIRDQGRNILKSQHKIIEEQQKILTETRTQTEEQKKMLNEMKKELEWREIENNSADITLDADTAHPNLSIAGDKKSLTHETQPQQVPPNPKRFDSTVCVLGSEGFSKGKHYWVVDVKSSNDWDLGVARESTERKGKLSLSPREGFWVLSQSGRDYWAKTDPWTRVTVQKIPKKIGVYLSYQERQVAFYNVTDMSVLFVFNDCSFSGKVCPFFKNSHKETTLTIC